MACGGIECWRWGSGVGETWSWFGGYDWDGFGAAGRS